MRQQFTPANRLTLDEVKQEFEHWRGTRSKRSPIPDHLWDSAVRLAQNYSIHTIAKTLRLNCSQLKRRVQAEQTQEPSQPDPAFIEFDCTSSLPLTEYHLETEDRHGSKLKMQLKGPGLPDPLDILCAFWSKGA